MCIYTKSELVIVKKQGYLQYNQNDGVVRCLWLGRIDDYNAQVLLCNILIKVFATFVSAEN